MSYLNAPATAMLATNCCLCGRALVDAQSVTVGIGPICRKKYGYNDEITEEIRVAANKLIHEAAASATPERVLEIADELEGMGATVLSEKLRSRHLKAAVRITRQQMAFGKNEFYQMIDGVLIIKTSYRPSFNEDLKKTIDWRDRQPVFTQKRGRRTFDGWAVKPAAKRAVWHLIKTHFQGEGFTVDGGKVTKVP